MASNTPLLNRVGGLRPALAPMVEAYGAPLGSVEDIDNQLAVDQAAESGAFGQGVTRGVRGLKSGFDNAIGLGAELAGNKTMADEYNASADRQNQLGALGSPDIPQLKDVHDFSTGARYAAGAAGAGLPYILPGVAGTTGARLLGAGAKAAAGAGFAANLAPMVGGEAERLRSDPVTAQLPIGERALTSLGVGAASAALYEVPAALQAGRAVGAAGYAARPGANILGGIAKDTLGTAAGMGAAGAGSEFVGQQAQNYLNPDRDTSGDNEAMVDAGVGGALGMLPLALPHAIVGNTVGAARGAVRDNLPGALDAAGNLIKSNVPGAADAIGAATDNVPRSM